MYVHIDEVQVWFATISYVENGTLGYEYMNNTKARTVYSGVTISHRLSRRNTRNDKATTANDNDNIQCYNSTTFSIVDLQFSKSTLLLFLSE